MNVTTSDSVSDTDWSGLQHLVNLEIMIIHDSNCLRSLPDGIRGLRHLKKLEITKCRSFVMLPSCIGDLANLEELIVYKCGRLATLTESMQRLVHLQKLVITSDADGKDLFFVHSTRKHSNIVEITEPHSVGGSISSIVLLQRISRVTSSNLSIFSLENVSSPEEAAKADIAKISNLRALRLHWSVNSDCAVEGPKVQDEAVLANLQPPRGLVVLDIDGYRGSVFRGWLSDASTLPCIREITLSSLSRCRHLPLLGLLPNLELLQIAGMPELTKVAGQPFKKLRELVLARFENLEEWSTEISSDDGQVMDIPMFPNLEYLEIKSCHELRFSPSFPASKKYLIHNSNKVLSFQGVLGISPTSSSEMEIHNCHFSPDDLRGFQYLSNLEELTISNCSALTTSPGSIKGLHSLKKLHVLECQDFATLPGCFGTLSSLQELTISKCSTLTTLPESIAGLHSLKKLHVFRCHNFTTLPECFGHLSSLQEVRIDSSAKLASLPESLRCTTCLVDLIFWCDDELERQYRSGIDSHKFAHIKNVKINGAGTSEHAKPEPKMLVLPEKPAVMISDTDTIGDPFKDTSVHTQ
uniref:NB-ARC domain-containing protein n=1 Tax=Oryza glumipatula TaxID=40148 RepID=A0A0E0ACF4_9ORYZ